MTTDPNLKPRNLLQRLTIFTATTRLGRWLVLHVISALDRRIFRWSAGRFSFASLGGLPLVMLTTTGARSGIRRETPLLYTTDGEKVIVIASRLGSDRHPDWYFNLRCDPLVELGFTEKTGKYLAREATGEERELYWSKMVALFPGYAKYAALAAGRQIPVIVFELTSNS